MAKKVKILFLHILNSRLASRPTTSPLSAWFNTAFSHLRLRPHYLIPAYFDNIIAHVTNYIADHAANIMSPFVRLGNFNFQISNLIL